MSELSIEFFTMLSYKERLDFGVISDSFAKTHMMEATEADYEEPTTADSVKIGYVS